MLKKIIVLALFLSCLLLVPPVNATPLSPTPPPTYEAQVIKVNSNNVDLKLLEGPDKNELVTISTEESQLATAGFAYKVGDHLLLSPTQGNKYYIVEYVRRSGLLTLFSLLILVVFVVGRWQGIFSFIGMIFSFIIIGTFIVPNILIGNDPVIISLLGALFIIPITFYIAHGINRKTTIAMVSTFITLIITGLLSYIFVEVTRLTGFAAEEAMFIQSMQPGVINIKNLLLAGIIIGAMGVLDDITISQTSIVDKLKHANPKYTRKQLYSHAMAVGRDHIASLVNTLILVYTGASLPLLVLFYNTNMNFLTVVNQEIIATEIVRTLVSSIGIVAAVPLATFLACFFIVS